MPAKRFSCRSSRWSTIGNCCDVSLARGALRRATSAWHTATMTSKPSSAYIQRHGTLTGGRPGPARFSKSVAHGQVLYVAGQVPYDVSDMTYKGQTQQVLKLVEDILVAGGSSKQSILKVSAFLRDIDAGADEYNAAWDEWADQQNLPVRTTVEAKLMRPEFLVEIDVVAAIA